MINKTLITLVILFAITGCDSSQQSTEKDGFFFKLNSFLTISQNDKQEAPKEKQKYHAQCSVGNVMTDEIVTELNQFGTQAQYVNPEGKKTFYVSNCKFTEL